MTLELFLIWTFVACFGYASVVTRETMRDRRPAYVALALAWLFWPALIVWAVATALVIGGGFLWLRKI